MKLAPYCTPPHANRSTYNEAQFELVYALVTTIDDWKPYANVYL